MIQKLLVIDPNKRLSAGQALKHEWFTKNDEARLTDGPAINIDANVLDRLQSFKGVSKLKKAAMNMLVKMADQKSIEELR